MTPKSRDSHPLRGAGLVLFYGALILVAVWLGCSRDNTPPGSPTQLTTTTSYDDNTPAFTWVAAVDQGSGVDHYLARVDGGAWMNLGMVTACNWGSALSDGSHSFELRAVDKHGNEGVSSSLTFLVDTTAPPKTWPLSPVSWSCTDDTTPSFEWGGVSDPSGVSYRLQVDNDTDFSSPCVNMHGARNAEYTLTEHLALADGEYYWRVCAVDGVGREGEWAAVWYFTVNTGPPPRTWLVSPANGSETDDTTPSFDWGSVCAPSGVTYWLQIAYDYAFSSVVLEETGLTVSEYTLTEDEALANGKYYWRVCAVDGLARQGDWTPGRSVTINAL